MKTTNIETHIEALAVRLRSNLPQDAMDAALMRAKLLCQRHGHDWSVVLREAKFQILQSVK